MVPFLVILFFGAVVCNPVADDADLTHRPWENPDLFEGDILGIDPDTDRAAVPQSSKLWPNGVIPYSIQPELKEHEALILKAMKHIEDRTCIRFRPATKDDLYSLHMYKGNGCFTYVGMAARKQWFSLGKGCYMHSIVVHELMHAVGFFHEHTRSDRDDYITIHWVNIDQSFWTQFTKLAPNQNLLFDAFDFDSIMLYGETAFSRDYRKLKSMTAKKPGFTIPDVYTKPGLSKSDIYRVKKLYKCK